MRILMISDVYFPRINGVSTSIESFRHTLAELDIHVDVVAPAYPAPHADDARITRVPARRVPFDPEDRLMQGKALRHTLADNSRQPYDLVHVQTPFAAHYAGLRHARSLRLPCIATYHTHFEEYLYNYVPAVPKAALRAFARGLARSQCNALDAVIVPSSAMHDTLTGYGVTAPLHRVPTGIPVDHFGAACRPASADFRTRFDIPAEAPVALFVGRAAHEKNIGFLLDALPHALQRIPGLILVVAGEGPALPALKRQTETLGIAASVRFVGYLDRLRELPACYAAADVFVFSSRTETQGLVLLEAMAAGLPVLAFAALGTREIVEPRRGALPAPQEPLAFGAAMAALLGDPQERRRMSKAARTFAREWTTEACTRRLADVYRTVLDRHPPSSFRHRKFILP
ncbi:MAG: glycosyltransferase [Rhodocyclaceae bacterium]|nr:glycosyltransferase [Rhodocyclaceae bacterium]